MSSKWFVLWNIIHDCLKNYLNVLLLNKFVLWLPNCNVIFKLSYNFFCYSGVRLLGIELIDKSLSIVSKLYLAIVWHGCFVDWSRWFLALLLILVLVFFFSIGLVFGPMSILLAFYKPWHKAIMSLLNLLELIILLWYLPLICSQ